MTPPSGLFEFPDPPSRHQPNHLNDLTNRDWMLFSKSFFRYEGDQALVDGMLNFFTKKLGSRSLVIVADRFRQFPVLRNVTHIRREGLSVPEALNVLPSLPGRGLRPGGSTVAR